MAKMEFAKIESVQFGAVMVDGSMQTAMSSIGVVKKGTATLNLAEAELTDIEVEESDTAYASKKGTAEKDLTMTFIGVETEKLAEMLGGTYAAATPTEPETISMPASASDVLRAVQMNGLNNDGEAAIIAIPKANIIVSSSDSITKDDVAGWTLKCKILQPVNGSGDPVTPLYFKAGSTT